jgi:hypothetical protein
MEDRAPGAHGIERHSGCADREPVGSGEGAKGTMSTDRVRHPIRPSRKSRERSVSVEVRRDDLHRHADAVQVRREIPNVPLDATDRRWESLGDLDDS